jgi:hypothetical protein
MTTFPDAPRANTTGRSDALKRVNVSSAAASKRMDTAKQREYLEEGFARRDAEK